MGLENCDAKSIAPTVLEGPIIPSSRRTLPLGPGAVGEKRVLLESAGLQGPDTNGAGGFLSRTGGNVLIHPTPF